ncbi:MAG TPA: histidine kinase, partial [Opitutaceae bacterium]
MHPAGRSPDGTNPRHRYRIRFTSRDGRSHVPTRPEAPMHLTICSKPGPDARRRPRRGRGPLAGIGRCGWHVIAWWILVFSTQLHAASLPAIRGLPFTRRYSFEDIGYGPRGARLDFDRFGRVAVIHDGVYTVLNDTVWLNIADRDPERIPMSNVVLAPDGRMYYGARASWGLTETGSDGLLHAVSLGPVNPPEWIRSAAFSDLITTADGVYFISPNGVVFWDFDKKEAQFYGHSRIARAFRVGKTVYISAFDRDLSFIDIETRTIRTASGTELDYLVVELATPLDETRSLLSLNDGRLVVFDERQLSAWEPQVSPWGPQRRDGFAGRVSSLHQLVDGHTAVAVTGKGLFLYSAEGELLLALTSSEYHRITALACREPGVLWAASEDGIEKILYSSAMTAFGQRLGLTLGWPIIERWQGRVFVASDGKLYHAVNGPPGVPTQFELYPNQPENGAWALAAWGPRMLVGGPDHVYSVEPDGSLQHVAAVSDMAHLVMINADHCYAIGRSEIALLEWRDGRWTESVARTQGVTYPSIVHRVKDSVWIEMSSEVGRLWRREGRLQLDRLPHSSWTNRPWVNIGSVNNMVVLSAAPGERRFFDENTGAWSDAPPLRALLERSPYWIARVERDEAGTIWATHDDGVVRFAPRDGDYEIDTSSFDLINDRYPVLQVLPGNDVWIYASQSLYHVEQRWTPSPKRPLTPILVSLADGRGDELLLNTALPPTPVQLPFSRNALTFQFFSGSDAGRRAPIYEYRLAPDEPWTPVAGSQVSFRGLHEGRYNLHIRFTEKFSSPGAAAVFPFEILPPWYRTWQAYLLFGLVFSIMLAGLIRWSIYMERRRNRMLERVVHDRTRQLEDAMARLGEETRHKATLAERDRLANEIHDSVQQGLTGAILQLDTTLKLPSVGGDIRSRLNVVRKMVSYARQEVQHAVWD